MQIENLTIIPYGRIYRLTNKINGKPYIGQTIEEDINNRWIKYKNLICKGQPKLYRALKKYGSENFLFEVIDTTPQNQSQLDELEDLYIIQYDSIKNGYNCKTGGSHGKHCNDTKIKMSKSHIGLRHSIETKLKIRKNNGMKNKKHTTLSKYKMSVSAIGRKHTKLTIDKISKHNGMLNKHHSIEVKLKISKSHMGKPRSEETKRKISESMKQRFLLERTTS